MKKSQKGVHLPDYSTTYIKDGKIQHGISRAGIKSREAANPSSFEEYDESPKAAKAIHGRVLGEIKQMPKPNLPKSEDGMEKDDMPHEAGSPEDSAHDVVEEHSSLQEELADLTPEEQSEMLTHLIMLKDKRQLRSPENQEVGMDKAGDKETPPTHIEGVHKPLVDKEGQYYSTDKGRSSAGSKAIMGTSYKRGQVYHGSTMNPVKGEMAQKLSDKNIGEAKQQHHSVLSEMKQMPKPNLPKSEMEKSEYSANEVAIEILKKAESMYKAKAEEWDDHKTDKRIEDLPMAQTREVLNENDIVNAVSQKLTDNSVQRLKQYLEAKKAKKEKK